MSTENTEVWADRFKKLPIDTMLAELQKRSRWPLRADVKWLDYENGDLIVSGPILKDVEELEVCASILPEVADRLEKTYTEITGNQMPWTISIAITAVINPRVHWAADPAGGAILYAPTRDINPETGRPFNVAVFPCTVAEWTRFQEATRDENSQFLSPGFEQFGSHPVVNVSYLDAQRYLKWRNLGKENGRVGIPSEEEWLFAATRGDGRTYPWGEQDPQGPIGEELLQWSGYISKKGTSSVHAHWRGVSPLGIHDMSGNVWEWTSTEHTQ